MNGNESRTLWISLITGIFAVFLLYSWSQEQRAELHKKYGSSEQVVVAKRPIKEMAPILDSDIDVIERPVDFIEPKAIQNPEEVIGKLAAAPIEEGEQILGTKLLKPGNLTGLSMEVTPGKRAVTIPVDSVRGVSKLIKPGDRIDIVAALDVGAGANKKREVRTLMQDVVVLATGQRIANQIPVVYDEEEDGQINIKNLRMDVNYNDLTIEAEPEEVQELVYILSTTPGGLFITLRNSSDRIIKPLKTASINDVLGRMRRKPAAAPRPVVRPKQPVAKPKVRKPRRRGPFEEIN